MRSKFVFPCLVANYREPVYQYRVGNMVQKRDMISQPGSEGTAGLSGMKIGIKRFGNSVQISLQCDGDYQAIELYDRLVAAAKRGEVTIDLKTR
jgi:hypothetical protein